MYYVFVLCLILLSSSALLSSFVFSLKFFVLFFGFSLLFFSFLLFYSSNVSLQCYVKYKNNGSSWFIINEFIVRFNEIIETFQPLMTKKQLHKLKSIVFSSHFEKYSNIFMLKLLKIKCLIFQLKVELHSL